jgi:anhydro-N-acetylmuramic acid kinase
MNTAYTYSIGLMSGTSLDGLDLVYVKFNKDRYTDFEILRSATIPYSEKWKTILQNAIQYSAEELVDLDMRYGDFLADRVLDFVTINSITKIDFIASHGHTVFHQPEKGCTLQVGNGQVIATRTKQKVVCDFRTQDVKMGGQGAPLVPIGDELLFSKYEYCINLGGFSNVSFRQNTSRIAFDICPVNIVLNFYVSKLGKEFDDKGALASKGLINEKLLQKLNELDFYKKQPPKSLGLEWVQEQVFPLIDEMETDVQVILRTFVEHIAIQISKIIQANSDVLFTGGGVFNSFLMHRIQILSSNTVQNIPEELVNYKEALIFSFLGLLRVQNEVNCLKSVTGASHDHSSGVIFEA